MISGIQLIAVGCCNLDKFFKLHDNGHFSLSSNSAEIIKSLLKYVTFIYYWLTPAPVPVAKDGFIFIFLLGNEHTGIMLPNAHIPCINKSSKIHKISRTKILYFLTIQNAAIIGRNCLCSKTETSKQKRGMRMRAVCCIRAHPPLSSERELPDVTDPRKGLKQKEGMKECLTNTASTETKKQYQQ